MSQPAAKKPSSRLLDFLIIGLLSFLAVEYVFPRFFGAKTEAPPPQAVEVSLRDPSLIHGQDPLVAVSNNRSASLRIASRCPNPPLTIAYAGTDRTASGVVVDAGEPVVPCLSEPIVIPAGESHDINLGPWKYAAFDRDGIYILTLYAQTESSGVLVDIAPVMTQVSVGEQGMIGKLYSTFITRPFLNFLVLVASVLPDHDLGFAIILLTIAVKLLLFLPTQRSLEGQKKMQLLQPQIEALRKKHKDDPVVMNQEIMKVWKENKINPFQSCLPLLLQFPVLIGLFHVIRDTTDLALSRHLLYGPFEDLSWTFNPLFMGLDLTIAYPWLFAPILVVLQFIQMKLTFYIADKKKAKKIEEATHQPDNPQDLQQKIMLYALPLMIGFFAFRVPSAVAVYWGVSTLFAIGQQLIVNREHLKVRASVS